MTAITQALSAALLHFIWQGTLVAFLLRITLSLLRNRSANARYLASCAALALMAALPIATVWMLYPHSAAIAIASSLSPVVPAAVRIASQFAPLAWIALWRQWTLPVWSIGVFLFALRLVLSCRHVAALRRMGRAAEGQLAETVSLLARRMKATCAIRVLISTVADSPSVVGWIRPVILLPAATLAGLEPEQLQAVLAHEIAHIRRHDYLVNLAQTLVETLLFYHPAVWWASARIRHERELCCDDAAVAACGDAIIYARALTSLERLRVTTPRLALGSTGGSLLYRIQRLAGIRPELRPSKLPGIAALALGFACFAMTVHWAKAQQVQQPAMPEEWGVTVSSTRQVAHRERVPYPEATYKNGIQGTVTLEATLDQSGNVADAHVLSGPPELRKTALQWVLQWQFADGRAGETQQVSLTFQQDARAQAQQHATDEMAQAHLTESFIEDELTAAQKKGNSQVTRDVAKKLQLAEASVALAEARNRALEDQASQVPDNQEFQVFEMDRQLEEARKTLGEHNPEINRLLAAIAALKQQLANFKQRNQRKLPDDENANHIVRSLEAQYATLMKDLGNMQQLFREQSPVVIQLKNQIETLRTQIAATSASCAGSPLTRIEIDRVPDSERDELAASVTVKLGEVLSQESIDRAIAALHQFDWRLQSRFLRADNGDVIFRITGPVQLK